MHLGYLLSHTYLQDFCSSNLSAENLLPILDSIVNITGRTYMTNHEFENLHFDCELDNQLSKR